MCKVVNCYSANQANHLVGNKFFDIAILDFMGVDAYELLKKAKKKGVIAVMLTAHALSVESTVKSFKNGVDFYVPKDELAKIENLLTDILETKSKGQNTLRRWLHWFSPYYEKKLGWVMWSVFRLVSSIGMSLRRPLT